MNALSTKLRYAADTGRPVSPRTARRILDIPLAGIPDLLAAAWAMKRRHFGDRLFFCSILNARSGACAEDCRFCAQSARHNTSVRTYGLMDSAAMAKAYTTASRLPIDHFGIVTSGGALSPKGVQRICRTIRRRKISGLAWCASLGSLDLAAFRQLKKAGLKRFHHNLETARSFFPRICRTHTYEDRLKTLRLARWAGLEVCSGGILGMGETPAQRVEFALALQRENVQSIPLNFLVPIRGTPLGRLAPMKPLDILRCIALFRLTNPRAEIKVCAGRLHLRDLQSMIFFAGATGMMIGPLLTVAGRDVSQDLRMLADLDIPYAQRRLDPKRT